jgi:hypothetical protein
MGFLQTYEMSLQSESKAKEKGNTLKVKDDSDDNKSLMMKSSFF